MQGTLFVLKPANACSATFICLNSLCCDEHDAVECIRVMLIAPNAEL